MATTWRVARSLQTLLAQLNEAYPHRSIEADGSIGDAAHAGTVSDHNPDANGVVRARDFTDDKAGGLDALDFREALRVSHDPRIKYVISEGQMFSSYPTSSYPAWTWRPYSGVNGHFHHVHVSVVADARADDTRKWIITTKEDDMTPEQVKEAVTDAITNYKIKDPEDPKGAYIGLVQFIRSRVARRNDVGYARDQLVAAVKAGQSAGAEADADAIVDALADRLEGDPS
jgi:hypothetical protein